MTISTSMLAASVSVEGPPGAAPLLLLHGIHLGRYSWQPHVEILRRSFRVAVLDLPRHGSMYAVPFAWPHIETQLRYVVEEVFGEAPLMVGYSLGGYCMMRLAQTRPDWSRGLLLAGCSLDPTAWRGSVYGALVGMTSIIPRPFFDALSGGFFRTTLQPALAAAIIASPFNPLAISETYALLRGQTFSSMLAAYPHPVLIANGQYDVVFRPQEQRFVKEARASHRVIKGSDHVFPLRRPAQFCDLIAEFGG